MGLSVSISGYGFCTLGKPPVDAKDLFRVDSTKVAGGRGNGGFAPIVCSCVGSELQRGGRSQRWSTGEVAGVPQENARVGNSLDAPGIVFLKDKGFQAGSSLDS